MEYNDNPVISDKYMMQERKQVMRPRPTCLTRCHHAGGRSCLAAAGRELSALLEQREMMSGYLAAVPRQCAAYMVKAAMGLLPIPGVISGLGVN